MSLVATFERWCDMIIFMIEEKVLNQGDSGIPDVEKENKYGKDLTLVTKNPKEKEIILEVAKLLGYRVDEKSGTDGSPSYAFYPPEKHRTLTNLDLTVKMRSMGITNLLEDYGGTISDEVKEVISSMLEEEKEVFSRPAEIIHPE